MGSRLKAITPAMTILVLMGVAIAIAILAGLIVTSQTRSLASKGATLQLSLDAHDAGGGYTAITVFVKNTGPEDVTLNGIQVTVNGAAKSCTWSPSLPTTIRSGSSASFSTICNTGAGVGSIISAKVYGTTSRTGTPVSASASTEVLP